MAPMTARILKHLQEVGSISGVEAEALYRCRHLPRRIADLKASGYLIHTELKKDATGQRYARYYFGQQAHETAA